MAIKNVINNIISNKNMSTSCMLFGLVISLAFVQLYQSNYINHAMHNKNIKEALTNEALTNETNSNIMEEITSLKKVEIDLYNVLDTLYLDTQLNKVAQAEAIQNTIKKIEHIDELRVKLYNNLITNYDLYQNNVIHTSTNATTLNNAVDVINTHIPNPNALKDEQMNSKRYIEVNTYYAKRYSYLTDIVKIIIYICIVMLILSSLANNRIIPEWLYSWALVILLVVGLYFLGKKIFMLFNVDNIDFDRLDWHFTPPAMEISAVASPPPPPSASTQ